MRPTKWLNLKRPFLSGPLSLLSFVAALPIWALLILMFLMLSTLRRLLSLFLRERSTQKVKQVSFTRAPSIPEPVSPEEYNDLLDPTTDAWEYASLRRQRSHLETCLDYSCPDFIPDYDDDLR